MIASAVYAHVSRDTEDVKYRVTLSVRPEPAITEKDVVLEAKVVRKADNSPVSGLKNVSFTILVEGEKVAELNGREQIEGAGWYDSDPVIFTEPGTYVVIFSFIDPNGRSYSLEFNISIKDREEFYVPGPLEWLEELEHLHEEEHRIASTVGSLNLTIKSLEDRLRTLENGIQIVRSSMQRDLSGLIYASLGIAIIALAIGILGVSGFRRG